MDLAETMKVHQDLLHGVAEALGLRAVRVESIVLTVERGKLARVEADFVPAAEAVNALRGLLPDGGSLDPKKTCEPHHAPRMT